jgi:hypothetical protein
VPSVQNEKKFDTFLGLSIREKHFCHFTFFCDTLFGSNIVGQMSGLSIVTHTQTREREAGKVFRSECVILRFLD